MADGSGGGRWFSAAALAGLPGLPATERRVRSRAMREAWESRKRDFGKGVEYAFTSLPASARVALLLRAEDQDPAPVWTEADRAEAWARYGHARQNLKDVALRRMRALDAVVELQRGGAPLLRARSLVAANLHDDQVRGASPGSLARWAKLTAGVPRCDWLPVLLPTYAGRSARADCHPEAWATLKALYLTRRAPDFSTCYRRLERAAKAHQWTIPSERTLLRRMRSEVTVPEMAWLRDGQEALEKLFPAQRRDRSHFAAMERVNGDGVLFVPWCIWPNGELARPKVWVWQCLGTGKILAWRADVSENTDMLRLAFGDLVDRWGLPRAVYLDNTMAAANTVMTGGVHRRYRFAVRDEPIVGILPQCGVEVCFVKPAHGQSKPIERAFRDLRQLIDHHPKYGAQGTKAHPLPIADWLAIFEAEIAAHNAQTGRRGGNFNGRSFDAVFAESYARATVRKATAEQRRLWLLAADKVTVNRADGSIALGRGPMGENRYWAESLLAHMGRKVVARFDPQKLHDPVHVTTLDGTYIGAAECTWRAGFDDSETGRAYHRARNRFEKASKEAARARQAMSELEAIRKVPDVIPPDAPTPAVIEGAFGRPTLAAEAAPPPPARTGTDDADTVVDFDRWCIEQAQRLKENAL